MGHRHLIKGLLLLFLIVALVGACEQPRSYPAPSGPPSLLLCGAHHHLSAFLRQLCR